MRATISAIATSINKRVPEFHSSACVGSPRWFHISTRNHVAPAQTPANSAGPRPSHHDAASNGVTYRSAIDPFTGHAVCSSSPWVNGLNLFSTGESYHPTRSGHSAGYLPLVTVVTG